MADIPQEQVFIEYVVKALVDNPDKVQLTHSVDDRGVLLELTVDPSDMGKIIGKAGATAKSIRTLLRVLGAKDDARYNLKIIEPEGSERPERSNSKDEPSEDTSEQEQSQVEQTDADGESTEVAKEESPAEDIKAKAREGIEDLDSDI